MWSRHADGVALIDFVGFSIPGGTELSVLIVEILNRSPGWCPIYMHIKERQKRDDPQGWSFNIPHFFDGVYTCDESIGRIKDTSRIIWLTPDRIAEEQCRSCSQRQGQ